MNIVICNSCKIPKPIDNFYRTNRCCMSCMSKKRKEFYENNKEKIVIQQKESSKIRKKQIAENKFLYYRNNGGPVATGIAIELFEQLNNCYIIDIGNALNYYI